MEWLTLMCNNQRTGYVADTVTLPLALRWKYWMGQYIFACPVVKDEIVYDASDGIKAIDLRNGNLIWENNTVADIGRNYSPAIYQNNLLVCTLKGLSKLRIEDGSVVYTLPYISFNAGLCCDEQRMYWGGEDPTTKERYFLAADIETGNLIWRVKSSTAIFFTPTLYEELVFFAESSTIFALERATGVIRWKRSFPGHPLKFFAVAHDYRLYCAVKGEGLYALDSASGSILWRFETRYGPHTAASVGEDTGTVYVASVFLYALDGETGELQWTSGEHGFSNSTPIVVGEHIFIGGGYYHFIHGFDRKTGEEVWKYPTEDHVMGTPVYASGKLLIGTHDQYLYCFETDLHSG